MMVRFIVFIQICLTAFNLYSQKISLGKYSTGNFGGLPNGIFIEFKDSLRFCYQRSFCMGEEKGIGLYNVSKNVLTLRFTNQSDSIKKSLTIETIKTTIENDSINLNIQVLDILSLETIPFGNIHLLGRDYVIDINGLVKIKIKKNGLKMPIQLSGIGYNFSDSIFTSTDQNLTFKVINNEYLKDGFCYKYQVIKSSERKLFLRNLDDAKYVNKFYRIEEFK